jgi:Asp-tRNA(Asn)/Glu-tRNA(Gln) amidotransferase C subunit
MFMDEKKKEEIRREAKEILDRFSGALEKVDVKGKDLKVSEEGFREEGSGEVGDKEFREKMFENAPSKEGDFILGEKKKW